jgi:DNA-binding MarR family transcriptional regulator/predicted N-acetyltransferase YhbS
MASEHVRRVRSFNRTVTERVGALDGRYLGRGRPLGEARVLWEIGGDGVEVRELRHRLALDSGYLSRLLRSLEEQGLAAVGDGERDRRVRVARLTRRGLAERREYDRRSDELAASILEPLDEAQRAALVRAMETVERLLLASTIALDAEEPASADARWCLRQYFAELAVRFEAGFEPARSPVGADELRPPTGLLLVARLGGRPVGCGALRHHPGGRTDVKRMWVTPRVRGLGLGRRLLAELERRAAAAGATVVRLETNRALTEAIALYRSAGYREVAPFNEEPYGDHWFEKRLGRQA